MQPTRIYGILLGMNDMMRLFQRNKLNDNIINIYLQMLTTKHAGFYAHNSFFYQFLVRDDQYEYSRVSRWTKNVNLFDYKKILVPIHVNENHWILIVIDLITKKINHYDSIGSINTVYMEHLLCYIKDEWYAKMATDLNTKEWRCETVGDVPRQNNGDDCGVFVCQFAKQIVIDGDVNQVNQSDMNYYRSEMINEIHALF